MEKIIISFLVLFLLPIIGFAHSSITIHNNCAPRSLYSVAGIPHGSHCWYASRAVWVTKHHSHRFRNLNHKCSYNLAGRDSLYLVKKHHGNVDIYDNSDPYGDCVYQHTPYGNG